MRTKVMNRFLSFLQFLSSHCKKGWCHLRSKKWVTRNETTMEVDRRFLNTLPKNPYLQSKVLWNDRYGDLQTRLENSYRLIFILACAIVVAIIGFVIIAGESKVKPYVTVIHGNDILTLNQSSSKELQQLHPKLARLFIKRFIEVVRAVSVDRDVNAQNTLRAYAFVSGAATQRLTRFYQKNNPDTFARHFTKEIHITSVLQTSRHTIEVRWQEDRRDSHSGKCRQSAHYIAQLTYRFQAPSEQTQILRFNPLGFYITHIVWSQDDDEVNHD